jgi:hypothetical protein
MRVTRTGLALAALALVGSTAACGTDPAGAEAAASSTSASALPADDMTRGIAEVEFARQCTIDKANFADEADLTSDLDVRLAAAGFTHEQWKRWHDALADSPELVAQFARISAAGCAGA